MLRRLGAVAFAGAASLLMADTVRAGPIPLLPVTDSTIVSFNDAQGTNSYLIEMITSDLKTWSYTVTELAGKDLSYWFLELCPGVRGLITYTSPTGAEIGQNGNTGLSGIKWNVPDSFTTGTFSFTLSEARDPEDLTLVVTKAGNGYGTSFITGPSCEGSPPVVPLPPAVWMGSVIVGGIIARRTLRRQA